MILTNVIKVNQNTIEFEVNITSANEVFLLTSYQCSFLFNEDIANEGQLTFGYIKGTTQLTNPPNLVIGIFKNDGKSKLVFVSRAGSDIIHQDTSRVGKFSLKNTVPFADIDPEITWTFNGKISTILTGESFNNITIPINFYYQLRDGKNSSLEKNNSNSFVTPSKFELFQNYPNPFNPSTKIKYTIPFTENSPTKFVQLKVYDNLGNEIEMLVNEEQTSGTYEVEFNNYSLSSGVYFYKLNVGKFSAVKKAILMR